MARFRYGQPRVPVQPAPFQPAPFQPAPLGGKPRPAVRSNPQPPPKDTGRLDRPIQKSETPIGYYGGQPLYYQGDTPTWWFNARPMYKGQILPDGRVVTGFTPEGPTYEQGDPPMQSTNIGAVGLLAPYYPGNRPWENIPSGEGPPERPLLYTPPPPPPPRTPLQRVPVGHGSVPEALVEDARRFGSGDWRSRIWRLIFG